MINYFKLDLREIKKPLNISPVSKAGPLKAWEMPKALYEKAVNKNSPVFGPIDPALDEIKIQLFLIIKN